jgi:SAM-dependent methyltransferase
VPERRGRSVRYTCSSSGSASITISTCQRAPGVTFADSAPAAAGRRSHRRLRARLLAAAQIQDGESILDIGCGCGDTTLPATRATGSGRALGADISRIQVAETRRLAAAAGVANARFEVADAQVHPFPAGAFDLVLSSLGVMFFDDPAAAFANLRKALRPGGRLAFLCWRTREENPVFTTGFAEAAAVLGCPGRLRGTCWPKLSTCSAGMVAGTSGVQMPAITAAIPAPSQILRNPAAGRWRPAGARTGQEAYCPSRSARRSSPGRRAACSRSARFCSGR